MYRNITFFTWQEKKELFKKYSLSLKKYTDCFAGFHVCG
ncbi:hypothetical protein Mpsy_1094 [Methanolobus psychrophilus R15]|nr:hypothetical protein Mpsy_1094 [Methanolobus psychrophilus R15]